MVRHGKVPMGHFFYSRDIAVMNEEPRFKVAGHSFKTGSVRYAVFAENTECVACGIKGKFFAIERNMRAEEDGVRCHANLYAIDRDGNEVLMTRDHIIPRSRGGKNGVKNMQTMCTVCNLSKGNNMPHLNNSK